MLGPCGKAGRAGQNTAPGAARWPWHRYSSGVGGELPSRRCTQALAPTQEGEGQDVEADAISRLGRTQATRPLPAHLDRVNRAVPPWVFAGLCVHGLCYPRCSPGCIGGWKVSLSACTDFVLDALKPSAPRQSERINREVKVRLKQHNRLQR